MSVFIAWWGGALGASAALMLLVLVIRAPVRRLVGPRLAYALWALPALRLALPPLPADMFGSLPLAGSVAGGMSVLFVGPQAGLIIRDGLRFSTLGEGLLTVWLAGGLALFTVFAVRHLLHCRRLRAEGTEISRMDGIRIIVADVEGPLAFGLFYRFIAVPRRFMHDYEEGERDLALAHERAHHVRGDLLANWLSLAVLAAHWWNPVAWLAIRAFREDQELATDAQVLAGREPAVRALYARVLAKAAGIGALPASNLRGRSALRRRLLMIGRAPHSRGRLAVGGIALHVSMGTALAATAIPVDTSGLADAGQAVTIVVKPDGTGGYALLVGGSRVESGDPLPGGLRLPSGFEGAGGCSLRRGARPVAMVIRGTGSVETYSVMCASAAPAPARSTLVEGLGSLRAMRASVATQPASSAFPEAERTHALKAIDRSIDEVLATLAALD
ncbi:MAG TPA: M56 family metallopeptidase [Azospirillaceae bacterium]|nr:M56 family metallopeptidase [Azospirillaceae bacterium]